MLPWFCPWDLQRNILIAFWAKNNHEATKCQASKFKLCVVSRSVSEREREGGRGGGEGGRKGEKVGVGGWEEGVTRN